MIDTTCHLVDNRTIPYYLQAKLAALDIHDYSQLLGYDYITIYKYLQQLNNNSLNLQVLFDLYCLFHQVRLRSLTKQQQLDIVQSYKISPVIHLPLSDREITANLELAYLQSKLASLNNEVPVGAVIVHDGGVIAKAYNQVLAKGVSTCHAEILAINQACTYLSNSRLYNCDLYVTLEPCLMCAGAIINSRMKRVIFSCYEPNTGAVTSQYQVFANPYVNKYTQAIKANSNNYQQVLVDFFKNRR